MPVKKDPETPEKTAQAKATPATPKAMDIHPVGTAPTFTTSRPVIVGNKSMASDPMLSVNKSLETKSTTPDETAAGDPPSAPVVNRHVKTISPLTAAEAEQPLEQENNAVAKSVEAMTADKSKVAETTSADEPVQPDAEAAETEEGSIETEPKTPNVEPTADGLETQEKSQEPTTVDEGADTELVDGATPPVEEETGPQEKTAEQMREDQLEEFIQKKTYAVPIDKTGRRRHNAFLALLLVLIAVVVTVNFLLDFGVITIPGAPSTDIFPPTSL